MARSRNALTSSGSRIQRAEGENIRRLAQPWQSRSFDYYDLLGEIKYASQFYSRMLAPLILFAAELVDGEWVPTENPEAIDALERVQDAGGGRTNLLGTYGRLMFLAGECLLFVSQDKDTGVEQWEMLSMDELRFESGRYSRYRAPSLGVQQYATSDGDDAEAWVPVDSDTAVAYRLWQRHPRYSMLADSTMQGVLDLCEELLLLTKAVRSRARSRLASSGILFFDDKISPLPQSDANQPDEDIFNDPFLADLTEAMTTAIVDEGSASSVVPLTVRVPIPEGARIADLVHHLQLVDPTQIYPETGLRYECIKRMAIGLDMPPEILLGLEKANHWSAWQIDDQTWEGHGKPKAEQLCDDLTSSYFRAYLAVSMGEQEAARFKVSYDPSGIVNHPDRSKDAKDLYEKRAIGKRALRDATGFKEDDAPTEEELAEMVGIAVRDGKLAWTGELSESPPAGSGPPPAAEEEGGVTDSVDVVKAAPGDEAVTAALVARVLGASDLALLRARESAGSKLLSCAKGDKEASALLAGGVPARDVAATLGRQKVRDLKAPLEADLVAGCYSLVTDAFRTWGIDEMVASQVADQVVQHASRTLYELRPRPLPASFASYVAGMLTT